MSSGPAGQGTIEAAVAGLSDYLYRYIRRKAAFLPGHPRDSPRRARRLLDQMGRPDEELPVVLLVGTKGKGSTAAMLEAIVRRAGYRTGLYTSPHLHTPRERIRVNGWPIARPAFAAGLRALGPLLEESGAWDDLGPATLFEGLTALAMAHFARHGVELALIEAGMGGRMDATHALEPLLTLLTPIGLDHQLYLGDTLEAIAVEKVGAVLPGGIALSAPQPDVVAEVVRGRCQEIGAVLHWAGRRDGLPPPGLAGPHQEENAQLAVAAVDLLREAGWTVPGEIVGEALRSAHWPGRLEVVAGHPLTLVDGAHNPAAARALAGALAGRGGQPMILVMGCSEDKDLAGIVAPLVPLADGVVVTRADHHRAVSPERLRAQWPARGAPVEVVPAVGSALARARGWAGPAGLVCVTGSLFVVVEAREALGLAVREPWPEPLALPG